MSPQASSSRGSPTVRSAAVSAPPEAELHSLLRMAVGDDILAVPIQDVREIIQISRMTPLPRTPAFVRGVMNLRGAVVPVIDLAARLGGAPTQLGRRSCIVVVEGRAAVGNGAAMLIVGLQVDAVHEVFDRNGAEVEPVPSLGTRIAPAFLSGMTRAGGQVVGVLSLPAVVDVEALTRAIAQAEHHEGSCDRTPAPENPHPRARTREPA